MKAAIFATRLEADFAISAFRFKKIESENFEVFAADNSLLAVSGVGMLSAALCVQYIVRKFGISEILNAGACGILGKKGKVGDVFEIGKVVCADDFCKDEFFLSESQNTLVSSSRAVKKDEERIRYAGIADFVDMECYGILKSLSILHFPLKNFSSVKVASDFSEGCDIKKNIPLVIKNLECAVSNFLK